MAPSTNSCKYKKIHHCKFAHNQQLETPNSHHSTGCPVNPLSFHQKHKAWLHRQQLRTKVERSHRGCGMLSTPWTVFDGCKLKHHRCSNLCTNTNVLKAVGIICHLGVLPTCLGGLVCSVFLRFCLLFQICFTFGTGLHKAFPTYSSGLASHHILLFAKTRSQSCKTLRAVESQIIPTPKHQQKAEKSQPTEWQKG